jgi:uncharacterized lipoprotein YmbA
MHRLSQLTIAGLALVLAACASSPPTLVALPSALPSAATPGEHQAPDATTTVRLRRVHVPDYLDGFGVVTGSDGHVLVVADRTEWAERPSQGVSRVLRDALAQRLGSNRVLIAGDGRRADADLSVELLALDSARDALTLDARWSLACRATGESHGGRSAVRIEMGATTPQLVATATSEALSQLADTVVAELRCEVDPDARATH